MKSLPTTPKKATLLTLSIAAILSFAGCDNNRETTLTETFSNSVRSGTVVNDDVEAPLSEKAKQYEKALATSNRFLTLWQQQDFQTIYNTLIDPEIQDVLSVEKLADIYQNVEATYGPMVSYKPMQWAFEPKRKDRQYFVFSIKVVQHENAKANYLFQFLLDGGFDKLIGVYVRDTPTLRAPGQIHTQKQ